MSEMYSLSSSEDDTPSNPPTLTIWNNMCLAAGFFPKDQNMSLTEVGSKVSVPLAVEKAVLSKTSLYYFAGFSSENIAKCEMNQVIVSNEKIIRDEGKHLRGLCVHEA